MTLSKSSEEKLQTCNEKLQELVRTYIKYGDVKIGISCGTRTLEAQQEAYKNKKSQLDGINKKSKHQSHPSKAFDFFVLNDDKSANWNDVSKYKYVAFYFKSIAKAKNIDIIWGGDFKSFKDYVHIELK